MATQDRRVEENDSRRTLIIVVAVVAAVVVALFFALLFMGTRGSDTETTLQGAIRAGPPELEQYKAQIVRDDPEAFESPRALGDIVMTLKTTVRNLSNKTLNGLEVRAAVVNHQDQPVKQKTLVVIPTPRQQDLAPNKTMDVTIMLDGFKPDDDRANIKMEIVAVRFKE